MTTGMKYYFWTFFIIIYKIIINFLDIIQPDYIYLGEKDFQQTLIIRKIIKTFNFKTVVKVMPTIRDKKNIALSSRNQFLKKCNNNNHIRENHVDYLKITALNEFGFR